MSLSYEAQRAVHVIAQYMTEAIRRKRKIDLVDAELEIRDALARFFCEMVDGAETDRRRLASRVRYLEGRVRRLEADAE